MIGWLKKMFLNVGDGNSITDNPIIHHFPDVGFDGQVTIDCIVRAAPWTYNDKPRINQDTDGGVQGITPACVGAFLVEVDEYGLRFRWQPREKGDDVFLSPFGRPPFNPPRTKPTTDGTE